MLHGRNLYNVICQLYLIFFKYNIYVVEKEKEETEEIFETIKD